MKLATALTLFCLLGQSAFAQEEESTEIEIVQESSDIELGEGFIAYHDSSTFNYGLKTSDGQIITQPIYSSIGEYIDGCFIVVNEDYLSGIIDVNANPLVELSYDELLYDATVKAYIYNKEGKAGLMSKNGKPLWNVSYSSLAPFIDNYAVFSTEDRYGLVDQSGHVVVPANYESIMQFDSKYYVVLSGQHMQVYNLKDQSLIIGDYQYLFLSFIDDLFIASKDGLSYGYVNGNGETVIPFQYSFAGQFIDGVASVIKTGEEEMININPKGEELKNSQNY
ncbi:hypothetical protein GQF61_11755 [Sphingobacterium sp. DK4209]|uniref:WG repeat-containing protein n=1 Tax=Sphingobacterium zhuxiongii TaxID=2662364 RepID=A0A5Q0QJ99_9SPHI|nr:MULTISPECIES: WG repeat-containing protein [unclassified Sphingobacterium]MVZ66536.1 hypothetical protein [Sphingobacterium sp. DK4209]QGA27810.1 hypothetical protein GFH32_16435 [Sphingobacterium sp. dk4302]